MPNGESTDDLSVAPTMLLYAEDAIGLLDHLGIDRAHIVGMVGMGACIGQGLAIQRPARVRSLAMSGAWASVDQFFRDQLELFRFLHGEVDFWAFQKAVTLLSFDPEFYNANKERLLGPHGGWKDLIGRFPAHSRLIDACLSHDTIDRLPGVTAPTLMVHCGQDQVNGPRLTLPISDAISSAESVLIERAAHVFAGREMKKAYTNVLLPFLAAH